MNRDVERDRGGAGRGIALRVSRRLVLWLLLLALPVYGAAGALAAMLGIQHRHSAAPTAMSGMAGWQDFRRAAGRHSAVQPGHGHLFWQRHHHSSADPTVLSLDGAAQDSSTGEVTPSSPVALPLWAPAAHPIEVHESASSTHRWPGLASRQLATRTVAPPERPPKS